MSRKEQPRSEEEQQAVMGKRPWEYPSFFKVMIGPDFKKTVRVPPLFKKHLGENPSDRVVLRTPRGQWQVRMGRTNGEFRFLDGWEDFVGDNLISVGEFAVFFYDGDAVFDVVIFGTSSCGREYLPLALSVVKPEPENSMEDISDDDMLPLALMRKKKKKNASMSNLVKVLPLISKKRRTPSVSNKRRKGAVGSKNMLCYKVMRAKEPNATYEKAIKAAFAFKSTHPHFIVTCRASRSSFLPIPAELDRLYNLAEKNSINVRDPNGILWPIKLSSWRDGRRCLASGWSLMYKKNCIKDGDACLLEFVQEGNEVNIHIFRPKDYITKSGKSIQSGERLLTNAETERVLKEANSLKTENPKFVVIWKLSMAYNVNVPAKVVKEVNLKMNIHSSLVDPSGRSWPVTISCRSHGQVSLGIGWKAFAKGNHLDVGDACVFEFLQGNEEIRVHIFRAQQTETSAANNILEQSPDRKSEVLLF